MVVRIRPARGLLSRPAAPRKQPAGTFTTVMRRAGAVESKAHAGLQTTLSVRRRLPAGMKGDVPREMASASRSRLLTAPKRVRRMGDARSSTVTVYPRKRSTAGCLARVPFPVTARSRMGCVGQLKRTAEHRKTVKWTARAQRDTMAALRHRLWIVRQRPAVLKGAIATFSKNVARPLPTRTAALRRIVRRRVDAPR